MLTVIYFYTINCINLTLNKGEVVVFHPTTESNLRTALVYLLFYVAFNSQGHIATGSLQVEETVNHRASASNYQLFNMKRPAQDSNRRPQRLEERTLTATPLSPLGQHWVLKSVNSVLSPTFANRFQGSCFQICVARWVFVVT